MGSAQEQVSRLELQPRLRVMRAGKATFGPGKADLLQRIADTGSIRSAATAMRMSYARAWNLVQEMNRDFRKPVVTAARGGSARGGAALTATGKEVLSRYAQMRERCTAAAEEDWRVLRGLMV